MRTLEYLTDPAVWGMYATALAAGGAIVLMCAVLSVLVVLKRLSFVGQGISHSAFGGIGVASVLGGLGWMTGGGGSGGLAEYAVVVVFCIAAALGMAAASDRRRLQVDTAIGLFLVASMALGAVLVQTGQQIARAMGHPMGVRSWESILFGSILSVGPADVVMAWVLAGLVVGAVWWWRRPMLFWAFDESSAPAFGVPAWRMRVILMVLLALAVVTAMRLAGVVLASALLVLPGATALKLSERLWTVVGLACAIAIAGLLAGLVLCIEADWQPGPSVVLVMTAMFGAAYAWDALRSARAARPA